MVLTRKPLFFLKTKSGQKGPFTRQQIKALLVKGKLTLDTRVRDARTDETITVREALSKRSAKSRAKTGGSSRSTARGRARRDARAGRRHGSSDDDAPAARSWLRRAIPLVVLLLLTTGAGWIAWSRRKPAPAPLADGVIAALGQASPRPTPPAFAVEFARAETRTAEGEPTFEVSIIVRRLREGVEGPVRIEIAHNGGSAAPREDVEVAFGVMEIDPSQGSSWGLSVTIRDDDAAEAEETIVLGLRAVWDDVEVGEQATHSIVVADND